MIPGCADRDRRMIVGCILRAAAILRITARGGDSMESAQANAWCHLVGGLSSAIKIDERLTMEIVRPTDQDLASDTRLRALEIAFGRTWTRAERCALLRKSWTPSARSGGEILLAHRLSSMYLFRVVAPREFLRTDIGDAVVNILDHEGRGQ